MVFSLTSKPTPFYWIIIIIVIIVIIIIKFSVTMKIKRIGSTATV